MDLEEVSLFDFGRGLIATLVSNGFQVPNENRVWHEFFYTLKKEERDNKPGFFNGLWFDWDAPYPKSPELSELFHALNIVYLVRSQLGKIVLDEHIISHWLHQIKVYSPELRHYFDYAAERATKDLMH